MLERSAAWLQKAKNGQLIFANKLPSKGDIKLVITANPPEIIISGCGGKISRLAIKLTVDTVPVILKRIGKTEKDAQIVVTK